MKLFTFLTLAPAAALALTGCGGDPDALTAASGQVSSTQAAAIATTISTSLGAINLSFTAPTMNAPAGGGPTAATIYDVCTTVSPGTGSRVDNDADGIALSKVYTYNCSNIVDSGTTYNLVGTESFTDKDDTKSIQLGGFSTAFDYLYSYKQSPRTNAMVRKGSFDLTPTSTNFTYTQVYSDDVNDTGGTTPAVYKQRSNWAAVYTPANVAAPTTAGAVSIYGFYAVNGYNTGVAGWGTMDVTWEVSSNSLTYQTGCTYYKGGKITMLDGGANSLVWEYSCTGVAVRLNGSLVKSFP